MTKYNELKEKFDILFKETLNRNKDILIESFIEYYGEEYRTLIKERFDRITFIYYFNFEFLKLSENYLKKYDESKLEYNAIEEVINSYNIYKLFNKSNQDIPNNFVGTTDNNVFKINDIAKNKIKRHLLKPHAVCFNVPNYKDIIIIPILYPSESGLIHEINHSITYEELAYFPTRKSNFIISKRGLVINTNKNDLLLEELINEKSSFEILKIFKSKGGDLTSIFYDIPFVCPYEKNFYLIDRFYNSFKEYIKNARISEYKNILLSIIGNQEYYDLVNLINKYYTEDLNLIEKNKEEALPRINEVLSVMNDNAKNNRYHTKDELELFVEELKSSGHTVKLLNHSLTMKK